MVSPSDGKNEALVNADAVEMDLPEGTKRRLPVRNCMTGFFAALSIVLVAVIMLIFLVVKNIGLERKSPWQYVSPPDDLPAFMNSTETECAVAYSEITCGDMGYLCDRGENDSVWSCINGTDSTWFSTFSTRK